MALALRGLGWGRDLLEFALSPRGLTGLFPQGVVRSWRRWLILAPPPGQACDRAFGVGPGLTGEGEGRRLHQNKRLLTLWLLLP